MIVGAVPATTDGDVTTATLGKVTQGQCAAITTAAYPQRYGAFGGSGITHDVVLEMGADMMAMEVAGDMFAVDNMTMAFSGMPNVTAGDYMYVLKATSGMQEQSRKWVLAVSERALPGGDGDGDANVADDREAGLHGNYTNVTDSDGESDAVASDWAGFVPANFKADINPDTQHDPPLIMNVPLLALPGTTAVNGAVGVTLEGVINSAVDVDVFWLGSLAPNWKLELKVVGTSTVVQTGGRGDHNEVALELLMVGSDTPVAMTMATDPTYDYEIGGLMGGLTCGEYYISVSGGEGEYTLAWRLTRPAAAPATP
jgi:hypothetical protein